MELTNGGHVKLRQGVIVSMHQQNIQRLSG
jgi:hypothetical protein